MDSVKYKWRSVNLDDFGTAGPNTNFEGLLGIEECLDYSVLSKRNARRKAQKEKKTETVKRKAPSSADGNVTPKKSKIISSSGFEVDSVNANVSLTPSKGPNTPNGKKKDKKNKNKPNQTNGIEAKDSVVAPNDSETPIEDAATKKKNKQKQKKAEKKAAKKAEAANGIETKEGEKKENTPVKKKKKRKPTKFERDRAKRDQRRADKKKDKAMKDKPANEDEAIVKPPEISSLNAIPVEDMQAWMQFSIPDVILRALADQGFRSPTQIQELTLPAALHGRRDILGAAETGSGKTLAFGIPILTGILRLKEDLANGIQEKTLNALPNALINPFVSEQAKIVNFNKLNKEEKKKLMKEIKSKKKYKSRKRVQRNDDEDEDDDDDEEDGEVSEDEDSDEDEADVPSDDDEASESDENGEMVVDDEISEQSDEESVDSDTEMLESDGDDDDEDLGIGSDEGSNQTPDEDEIIGDDEMEPANNDDDEESDFEEREEEVEGLNEEGIGCVKVIDNVSPSEIIPEVPGKKKRPLKPLYALILTPTRELAIQVKNHLVAAAKYMDILIAVVVGGMAEVKQERVLKHCPEIVVATPGRLWQMIQQGNRHLSQVTDIRYLAIDETDRMMERGHFEELHHLLDKVNDDEQRKARRQTFVFSATLTMVHDLPHHLKGKKVTKKGKVISKKVDKLTAEQKLKKVIEMLGITDPKVVDVTVGNQGSSDTLTECRIICPIDHKDFYLYYVLKRYPGRTIVFCNSIGCVKRLAQLFGLLACNPLPIHASMQQRQRLKNLDKFRDSPHGLLIATDVAARGLDIPNVEHVIHYQVPRTAENYVHRSGRTARASKEGIAILIMEPTEVQNYTKMCKTLAKTEDLPHFPVDGALLAAVRLRVDLARELDLLTLKVRKDSAQRGWLEKAALDMDMVIDDTDMPHKMENQAAADLKNVLVIKKKQLTQLLNSPLFPKGFSFKFPTNNMLESTLTMPQRQNAVQAMKSAMDSGLVKKLKKATKNEAMLNLPADLKNMISHSSNETLKENNAAVAALNEDAAVLNNGEKVSKNKWKKLKRTVAT